MGNIIRFPGDDRSKPGFERVRSTYSVRDISQQFGLSMQTIRRWTHEGLVQTAADAQPGEIRYDFRSLTQFRRVRELRSRGLTLKQIDAELHGQMNLFPEPGGRLLRFSATRGPFEQALLAHESDDPQAGELYARAIRENNFVPDAYCNLGILEFDSGNTARAFDCFSHALRQDARHFESHFNLAYLYFESGDLRLARLHYEMAAEIEPGFHNVYFNLGIVNAMQEDLPSAQANLTMARELAPDEDRPKIEDLLLNVERALRHAAEKKSR